MRTLDHSYPVTANEATVPAQYHVRRGFSSQLHCKLQTNFFAYYLSGSLLHSCFPSATGFSLAVPQLISHRCLQVPFAKGTLPAPPAPYASSPLAKPFVLLRCLTVLTGTPVSQLLPISLMRHLPPLPGHPPTRSK